MKKRERNYIQEAQSANWLDADAVRRVAEALGAPDAAKAINACTIGEVRHVVELLARVIMLENEAPGFTASMIDTFLPHFIREGNRRMVEAEAQSRADAGGFGAEWARAIAAGHSKGQSGFKPAMVDVVRAAQGLSASDATGQVADHYGIDPESVNRSIRRARKKP